MMYEKPYFNGQNWVIAQKNQAGLTILRLKFDTEEQAIEYYNNHTEQQKPKPAENKIMKSSTENKGMN